jgi:predicted ATP-dependent serine protease
VWSGLAAFGEIGLTGRLRAATQVDRRLEECTKLGIRTALAPSGTPARGKIRIEEQDTLRSAIKAGLDGGNSG